MQLYVLQIALRRKSQYNATLNMTHESLVNQVRLIERKQISADQKLTFLASLRTRVLTDPINRSVEWKRGRIYFHDISDIAFSAGSGVLIREIQDSQSCFVGDFDQYLADLPSEEKEMHQLFQAIFEVGTSFVWEEDITAAKRLHDLFKEADTEIIRPWVNQ